MLFLPGDALIFSIGMIAANDEQNHLHIEYIIPLLMLAAIIGDNVNYYVGRKFGGWILGRKDSFFLKKKHIEKATVFFNKNGKKAIIIARFMPVVRTIIPFICGVTNLNYKTFIIYSFIGAVLWVGVISMLGHTLGQFDLVKNSLEKFIFGKHKININPQRHLDGGHFARMFYLRQHLLGFCDFICEKKKKKTT